jgi:hypothetical protein
VSQKGLEHSKKQALIKGEWLTFNNGDREAFHVFDSATVNNSLRMYDTVSK